MKTQIIICEDDLQQTKILENKIRALSLPFPYTIFSFNNLETMFSFCQKNPGPSIFLMDIVLQENENGIRAAKRINTDFPRSIVIYISAYLEKVTDIYETNHCYFIYKPEIDQRLSKALIKAFKVLSEIQKSICIRSGTKQIVLSTHKIYAIERIKRYSLIHCKDTVYKIADDFNALEPQLTSTFYQCHRSYLVNFDKVQQCTRTDFQMKNGTLVPISRSFGKKVHEQFQEYLRKLYR